MARTSEIKALVAELTRKAKGTSPRVRPVIARFIADADQMVACLRDGKPFPAEYKRLLQHNRELKDILDVQL